MKHRRPADSTGPSSANPDKTDQITEHIEAAVAIQEAGLMELLSSSGAYMPALIRARLDRKEEDHTT